MKTVALLALLVAACGIGFAKDAPPAARPNVVFILADDMGWRDLGVYGSTFHETPNLDRLAAQGVRFTNAYAACSVCSPTRASILTGRYPARVGITDWLPGRKSQPQDKLLAPELEQNLDPDGVTLGNSFHDAGYRTAFIGKWHLGEDPEDFADRHGFDLNIGGSGKGHPPSYFSPYRLPNLKDGPKGEHLDDRLTREAIDFVSEAAARKQPFLLYLSHYAVHTPLQGKPELIAKYEAKLAAHPAPEPAQIKDPKDGQVRVVQSHPVYAAMMESIDSSVGRLVAKLDELGLRENTIIVFTSDNGGLSTAEGSPTSNLPLRGGKGWGYEGGVREPLIVSWPGRIAGGRTSDDIVTSTDYFPTLLDLAGLPAQPAAHLDGVSFARVLRDASAHLPERAIFWHYPHYSNQRGKPNSAMRAGRWKLIEWLETGKVELFDLSTDIGETKDLRTEYPKIAEELLARLHTWRESVGARMPTPNPNYRPKP